MAEVVYRIVEHDGGWAYKLGDVFSETFPSHEAAKAAADRVAAEQRVPDETETISWQDETGAWREEIEPGNDRPDTRVEDSGFAQSASQTALGLRGTATRNPLAFALLAVAFGFLIGRAVS